MLLVLTAAGAAADLLYKGAGNCRLVASFQVECTWSGLVCTSSAAATEEVRRNIPIESKCMGNLRSSVFRYYAETSSNYPVLIELKPVTRIRETFRHSLDCSFNYPRESLKSQLGEKKNISIAKARRLQTPGSMSALFLLLEILYSDQKFSVTV